MTCDIDFSKERAVLGGPYSLFDGSIIGEFLDTDGLDATFLIRVTIIAKHPLVALEKNHPMSPPLHVHFDQAESFQVMRGKWGLTTGWEEKDVILTPASGAFLVPIMMPHTPWPVACDEDSVVYAWGHPRGTPKPMENDFFQQLFLYTQELFDAKQSPDLFQLLLMQHETNSTGVMLPSLSFLGPLRWWIPWHIQGAIAGMARLLGYSKDMPKYLKTQ